MSGAGVWLQNWICGVVLVSKLKSLERYLYLTLKIIISYIESDHHGKKQSCDKTKRGNKGFEIELEKSEE